MGRSNSEHQQVTKALGLGCSQEASKVSSCCDGPRCFVSCSLACTSCADMLAFAVTSHAMLCTTARMAFLIHVIAMHGLYITCAMPYQAMLLLLHLLRVPTLPSTTCCHQAILHVCTDHEGYSCLNVHSNQQSTPLSHAEHTKPHTARHNLRASQKMLVQTLLCCPAVCCSLSLLT